MLGLEILDLSKVKEHQVIDLHDNVRYALDCSSFDGLMRVAQFKGDLLASEVSVTSMLRWYDGAQEWDGSGRKSWICASSARKDTDNLTNT